MAMKEGTRAIWDYIVAHDGEDMTAQTIADALGVNVKSVNGSVTSFQKKGHTIREEVAVTGGKVKYIRLTDEGRAFDPDAEPVKD
jgi:DNA-binding MarR family transcriptional regulator